MSSRSSSSSTPLQLKDAIGREMEDEVEKLQSAYAEQKAKLIGEKKFGELKELQMKYHQRMMQAANKFHRQCCEWAEQYAPSHKAAIQRDGEARLAQMDRACKQEQALA